MPSSAETGEVLLVLCKRGAETGGGESVVRRAWYARGDSSRRGVPRLFLGRCGVPRAHLVATTALLDARRRAVDAEPGVAELRRADIERVLDVTAGDREPRRPLAFFARARTGGVELRGDDAQARWRRAAKADRVRLRHPRALALISRIARLSCLLRDRRGVVVDAALGELGLEGRAETRLHPHDGREVLGRQVVVGLSIFQPVDGPLGLAGLSKSRACRKDLGLLDRQRALRKGC